MFDDIVREITIIEVKQKKTTIGKFVDIHTIRRVLSNIDSEVSYHYETINEKKNPDLFWKIIRSGYILDKTR